MTLTAAILISIAMMGCGSSDNGVASKAPPGILAAAQAAAASASSVRISGGFAQGGLKSTIDVVAASGRGARGRLSLGALAFNVIVIGDTIYLNGDRAVYEAVIGSAATRVPAGTWLKASASGQLSGIAASVDQKALLGRLLAGAGTPAKGATTLINGQRAIQLKLSGAMLSAGRRLFTGSLYVATTGKPNPVELVKRGLEHGQVTFTDWDKPATLAPPANSVDIARLRRRRS